MLLFDVNVLVSAFRADAPRHGVTRDWLSGVIASDSSFGVSELVLSGFLRVVTHPRVFDPPTPLDAALEFSEVLLSQPNCVVLRPGPRHWDVFVRMSRGADVRGNLVPDAYLAALAVESGSELVTSDRDFARFDGLRWRTPTMT